MNVCWLTSHIANAGLFGPVALLSLAEGRNCGSLHLQHCTLGAVQEWVEQAIFPAICRPGPEAVGGH